MQPARQGPVLRGAAFFVLSVMLLYAPLATAAEKKAATKLEWTGMNLEQYSACIDEALSKPEDGFEQAIAWRDMGGGAPAKHCVAVALFALGQYENAGLHLERIASEQQSLPPTLRTALLGQAGNAWMTAGDFKRADAALSAALKLAPDDAGILLQRSLAAAAAESYYQAIDDLNRIVELKPDDADALVYRATAYRYLDALELADDDIERALAAHPDHPAALLERGNLRRLKGEDAAARPDWLTVIHGAPDSEAAEAARRNIEALDIKAQ